MMFRHLQTCTKCFCGIIPRAQYLKMETITNMIEAKQFIYGKLSEKEMTNALTLKVTIIKEKADRTKLVDELVKKMCEIYLISDEREFTKMEENNDFIDGKISKDAQDKSFENKALEIQKKRKTKTEFIDNHIRQLKNDFIFDKKRTC